MIFDAEEGCPFIQFPDDLVMVAMEHIRAEKMQHTVGRHGGEFPQFFIQSRAHLSSTFQFASSIGRVLSSSGGAGRSVPLRRAAVAWAPRKRRGRSASHFVANENSNDVMPNASCRALAEREGEGIHENTAIRCKAWKTQQNSRCLVFCFLVSIDLLSVPCVLGSFGHF